MKVAKITSLNTVKDINNNDDYTIYIDTDSIFVSSVPLLNHRHPQWKGLEQDDIAKLVDGIAGEMQDYLNNFYDILASKVFNVPKDKHRLEIKKEYVAKAGLWVAKKRYAQWIISDNGVPVDKLDVKGLDVKRSSFPKAFQDIMADVLISILRGETEEGISDKVMDFKKNLVNRPVYEVAKNSAVKNISKYLPKKKKEVRVSFSVEKGTPAHVKAAIAYNDCLKHFNCAYKYEPMKDGDKIKWVYLKDNPLGLEGLGFTGYNDPDEILDFVKTYIDYNKIFDRELKGKLQDFYDAVGWGEIVNEGQSAKKFFSF